MRHFIAGPLLVLLTTAAIGAAPAPADGLSFREFSDWYFAHCAGQRALGRGDLAAASHRFREAIRIAWPGATSEPWPLARTYTDFALVLLLQGRAREAEPLAEWALTVREEQYGKNSKQVATTLHVLAQLASAQNQYARSEVLLGRALGIWQKQLGSDSPQMAIGLNDLATVYALQRKYDRAETVYRRVLENPTGGLADRAISLIGLASLFSAQGQFELAESFDQQLLELMARMSPVTYELIAPSLEQYLAQLRKLGRSAELAALSDAAQAASTSQPVPLDPRPRGTPPPLVRGRPRST